MTISRVVFALVGMAGLAAAQSKSPSTITVSVYGVGDCPAVNWTFDASQTAEGQITRGQISALVVNRELDKCSPQLFQLVPLGLKLQSVVVRQYDPGGTSAMPVLTVTLTGVRVSNYQVGGSTASRLPGESVSLSFESIKLEYRTPPNPDGSGGGTITAGWDFTTNSRI